MGEIAFFFKIVVTVCKINYSIFLAKIPFPGSSVGRAVDFGSDGPIKGGPLRVQGSIFFFFFFAEL